MRSRRYAKNTATSAGYPSDEKTMRFIKRWVAKNGSAPEFARRSWKPLRLMLEQATQCKLYGL